MSILSPLKQYHFHAILIWWHSPFSVDLKINDGEPHQERKNFVKYSEHFQTS